MSGLERVKNGKGDTHSVRLPFLSPPLRNDISREALRSMNKLSVGKVTAPKRGPEA